MAKKKKANGNGGALIYMVLDKSGSMEYRRDDTIEGCNRFLGETKEADPEALFSLLLFDTSVTKVHTAKPLSDIEPIDGHVYSPGGGTALLDAVGHAVKDIEEMKDQPSKVVVAVFTDGQENSSHEYTREAVKASVARHEKENGWQFLFLGANLDSFAEAGAIGVVRPNSTTNWRQTPGGTRAVYMAAASGTSDYLTGATMTANVSQAAYEATASAEEALDNQTADTTNQTLDQKINSRSSGSNVRSKSTTK